jgi:hypothetical protein
MRLKNGAGPLPYIDNRMVMLKRVDGKPRRRLRE